MVNENQNRSAENRVIDPRDTRETKVTRNKREGTIMFSSTEESFNAKVRKWNLTGRGFPTRKPSFNFSGA